MEIFIRKLTSEEEDEFPPAARAAVIVLCKMYALDLIAKNAGDFLEVGIITYIILIRDIHDILF